MYVKINISDSHKFKHVTPTENEMRYKFAICNANEPYYNFMCTMFASDNRFYNVTFRLCMLN